MKIDHAFAHVMLHRIHRRHDATPACGAAPRALARGAALLCAAAWLSAACGEDTGSPSSTSTGGEGASLGGSLATGASGSGAAPAGGSGGTTSGGSGGQGATGGVSPSGGTPVTTGGVSTGGIGGVPTGGTGGAPTGGIGGLSTGGTGGVSTGGTSGVPTGGSGGISTGGVHPTGGIAGTGGDTGGTSSGGAAPGGAATGGTSSGGAATGGEGEGGSATGGSGTGGGTSEEATIVPDPGWACGMAEGIPSPTRGELAFTITLDISDTHDVGDTPYGHRRFLEVSGGAISGARLSGSVLTGGLEYELTLSNGVIEYQGINILEASDGSRIFVRSCGVAPDESGTPRVIPDFEATTTGSYAFLNTGKFVATREVTAETLRLDVYDVSTVTAGEPRVQITKPEGVPPQPWECNTTTGSRGATVFTEAVSLGGSFSIANAKYGSRNVIPITGGTTTGRVEGAILNGGADYQLSGSLDAWYTLAPNNGELILVRNCGAMGGLIPWFEARVDGEFDFLNDNTYLSSEPGMVGGGVSITFYERQ